MDIKETVSSCIVFSGIQVHGRLVVGSGGEGGAKIP